MAKLHTTPSGKHSVLDPDVKLSSLQIRALMICRGEGATIYDLVQTIRSERELQLLSEVIITREVANLCTRGLIAYDRGTPAVTRKQRRGR